MKKTRKLKACSRCAARAGTAFPKAISMAFQPIFDCTTGEVFAQEALVRGKQGQCAREIFDLVTEDNRYSFDQLCRTTAIEVATRAGIDSALSINFMPNAVYEPKNCIQHTLWTADKCHFDTSRLIFEFTETELVRDTEHLKNIINTYRSYGFRTAIDDFGAGFAGLNLISDVIPDIVKLDRHLIVGIDTDKARQAIVRNLLSLFNDLGVQVIAEGIETAEEMDQLQSLGVQLMQGYHLAKPCFEALATQVEHRQARAL